MFNLRKKVKNSESLLLLVIIVAMCQSIAGCGDSNINKAEKLIEVGMFDEAAALLERELIDSPTNAKTHMLLGMTNVYPDNLSTAAKNFSNAIRLNPGLANKIGQYMLSLVTAAHIQSEYKTFEVLSMAVNYDPSLGSRAAKYYIDHATTRKQSAQKTAALLHKAINFDPRTRSAASNLLLERGKTFARDGELNQACEAISLAVDVDSGRKEMGVKLLVETFTQIGQTLSINDAESVVKSILSLDENAKRSIGIALLAFAKEDLASGNVNKCVQRIRVILQNDLQVVQGEVKLLVETFTQIGQTLSIDDAESVVKSILSLDENAKRSVGAILLAFAKEDLTSGNVNKCVQRVETVLQNRHLVVPKNEVRSLLVNAANQTIANETDFVWTMRVLVSHFRDISQPTTLIEKYIYGTYLWIRGDRSDGLKFLRQVPDRKRKELGIEFVDSHIPVGIYPLRVSKRGDFGYGTFTFTIDAIEVKSDKSTRVKVRVKNHTNRSQRFIFFGIRGEQRRRRGGDDERFIFLMNLAKSFMPGLRTLSIYPIGKNLIGLMML